MEEKKLSPKLIKTVVIAAIVIIAIAMVLSAVFSRPGGQITKTESSIKEIIKTENLSTVEYIYNSIVEVKDEDAKNEKTLYYVSYEGTTNFQV